MAVVITKDTKVVVQGATGHQGQFHIQAMKQFGTNVVAGVNSASAVSLAQASGITPGCCSMFYFNPDQPDTHTHTWNLTIEKEVAANTVARVRYLPIYVRHPDFTVVHARGSSRRRTIAAAGRSKRVVPIR